MSDEVTLIQAWLDQGQQTDNGGIPIPPRMEEVAIARIRKRLFGPGATPTGEPTWALDPTGQVERLADYLNDCDGADPSLPAADQAMNLLTQLQQLASALLTKEPDPLPGGARLMTTAPSWWRKVNGADYIIGVSYYSEAADETTYVCAGRWDGRITLTMCSDSMDRSPSGCRVKHVAIADSAVIRAVLSRAKDGKSA